MSHTLSCLHPHPFSLPLPRTRLLLAHRYGGTGKKSHGRQFDSYGEEYTRGNVIGCLLDTAEGVISYSKNGKLLGPAFKLSQQWQGQVSLLANPGTVVCQLTNCTVCLLL